MTKPRNSSAKKTWITDDMIRECLNSGMTVKATSDKLGISERSIYIRKKKMAQRDADEHTQEHTGVKVPEAFRIHGVSTMHHRDKGEVIRWIKTTADSEKRAALIEEAAHALCEQLPVYAPVTPPKAEKNHDLCNLFVLTDYHLGMLSWGEETGDDWDCKIAEETLIRWLDAAIGRCPNASTAVLAQLGDFMHFDGFDAVTPTSGHLLDADGRFQKLVRIAIRALRHCVDKLLACHDNVHLIMAEGNHDIASSVWLTEMFATVYANEPRVTVDTRPDPYYCFEFGKTSLFFHHGHKCKPAQLEQVFVAKFRDVFGRTEYSYGHCGHLHHREIKEGRLMEIEQHQTLAAKDAYASRGGWLSKRGAKVCTYHREYGFVGDINVTPEMVK